MIGEECVLEFFQGLESRSQGQDQGLQNCPRGSSRTTTCPRGLQHCKQDLIRSSFSMFHFFLGRRMFNPLRSVWSGATLSGLACQVSRFLRPLPWWTRQLANSLPIWEERFPQPQAMRGKVLFCSAESFGAGATLQRCLVTWHLARTDVLYPILYYLNFQTPSGTYLPWAKDICVFVKYHKVVTSEALAAVGCVC